MKKRQRQKIIKNLLKSTAGIWKKGDGLAYQEKLGAEWEQRLQENRLLKASDETEGCNAHFAVPVQ